ncbi:MAG: hypothetical protein ACI8RD_002465 [Bacillariaceae sp.]|jgi:hypothetical protein
MNLKRNTRNAPRSSINSKRNIFCCQYEKEEKIFNQLETEHEKKNRSSEGDQVETRCETQFKSLSQTRETNHATGSTTCFLSPMITASPNLKKQVGLNKEEALVAIRTMTRPCANGEIWSKTPVQKVSIFNMCYLSQKWWRSCQGTKERHLYKEHVVVHRDTISDTY